MVLNLTNSKAKIVMDGLETLLHEKVEGSSSFMTNGGRAYYEDVQSLLHEIRLLIRSQTIPAEGEKAILMIQGRQHTCRVSTIQGEYRLVLRRGDRGDILVDSQLIADTQEQRIRALQLAHDFMLALEGGETDAL